MNETKQAKRERKKEKRETKRKNKRRRGLSRNKINTWRKLKGSIGFGAPVQMQTLLNLAFGVPPPKGNFQTQV